MQQKTSPKVIFFDVNETLLDLAPVKASITQALEGKSELVSQWFTSLLHYSLVLSAAQQFETFDTIGTHVLMLLAESNGISLSYQEAKTATAPLLALPAHAEVPEALELLKAHNYRLVALTNSSQRGMSEQLSSAKIAHYFEHQLSVEQIKTYKPHTTVYHWASEQMNILPTESLMVAAHGWDIAGALWAGWRAAFVQRPGKALFPLAPQPEIIAPNVLEVAQKLIR
ncbi:MAG: haloacid dehalogenase type II [Crocinitomicaceae bacterium]|nr:haloacid dehalogenase type II [Crocinitomicaceae bacterium]|tara:strand:- start:10077 stop:10757 length:681 start_codon:yes stop_codon:yes gene_type:complete